MNRSSVTLLVCLACLYAACGTDVHEADHHFEITVEEGVSTATNTGGPKYTDELFSYELVVELQEDEREESFLRRPDDFYMDERGWLYVPDYGDRRIAVFDSAGRYSHSIGREGGGPGELRGGFRIVGLSHGIVTVSDPSQNRITRFTTDGDLIEVIPVARPTVFLSLVYPVGEDLFLGLGAEQTSPSSRMIRMRSIALLHNASGDTLAGVTTPWFDFGRYDATDNVILSVLFQPQPAYAFQEGFGFLVTTGESPSTDVHDLSGQVVRHIELGLERLPTTAQDRDRLKDFYDAEMAAEGINEQWRAYLARQRERGTLAEYRAFWQDAQIDDAGFIWLQVPEHPLDAKNAEYHGLWRLVSPEGEYLGLTRRPPRVGRVMRGHLLAMDADVETGTYRLLVYRITPAVNGLQYP